MTSFAFILGVVPLVLASGAGRRRDRPSARPCSAACWPRRCSASSSSRCSTSSCSASANARPAVQALRRAGSAGSPIGHQAGRSRQPAVVWRQRIGTRRHDWTDSESAIDVTTADDCRDAAHCITVVPYYPAGDVDILFRVAPGNRGARMTSDSPVVGSVPGSGAFRSGADLVARQQGSGVRIRERRRGVRTRRDHCAQHSSHRSWAGQMRCASVRAQLCPVSPRATATLYEVDLSSSFELDVGRLRRATERRAPICSRPRRAAVRWRRRS